MSKYNFNAADATIACVNWIKNWFEKNAAPESKAVVGISGGKDSSIVATLCAEALGVKRVIGVMMPCISCQMLHDAKITIDELLNHRMNLGLNKNAMDYFATVDKFESAINALNDGYKLCHVLGIEHVVININETVQEINKRVEAHYSLTNQAKMNLLPRVRMTTLYAVSQSVNGRVANTSNFSEKFLGYGTRWGDTVGDFSPLGELTCTEVKMIGKYFGLPKKLVNRTPDDGLCGKSDEESFGFTYEQLDNFIRVGTSGNEFVDQAIKERAAKNEFKLKPISTFDPSMFITK